MHRILFVCHANVCRSPLAEYVMKQVVREAGMESEFHIESAGTDPDLGCDIWPDSKMVMDMNGVPWESRCARQLVRGEYGDWDRVLVMDFEDLARAREIFGGDPEGKVSLFLGNRAVGDPYFSGDFGKAYAEIRAGCESILKCVELDIWP